MEEGEFHIPEELREKEVFVCYRIEVDDDGDTDKPPYKPTNREACKTSPNTTKDAVDFETAKRVVENSNHPERGGNKFDGIGLIVEEESNLAAFDLDDCFDAETGTIADYALEIISSIPSYVQISQSGTGLHIYFWCPDGLDKSCKNKVDIGEDGEMGIELYDDHYFCVTGRTLKGCNTELTECGDEARDIQRAWMNPSGSTSGSSGNSGGSTYRGETDPLEYNPKPYECDSYEMREEDWELVEEACEMSGRFEDQFNGNTEYSNRSDEEFSFFLKLAWFTQECSGRYPVSDIDMMGRV
jgi:hypothetical protein